MTQPGQQPSPADATGAVPALVLTHDAEALALEHAAANAAAGPLRHLLAELLQAYRLRWVRQFRSLRIPAAGPDFTNLMGDLARQLAALRVDPGPALLDYAERASALGVEQGWREAGLPATDVPMPLPLETRSRAASVVAAARQKAHQAAAMAPTMRPGTYDETVARVASPLQQAANVIERAARIIANERLNAGIGAVADAAGGRKLWIAERDACLTCAALSGHLLGDDGTFGDGTGFGGRPAQYAGAGFDGPPAHDHCRCRVTVYFGHDEPADAIPAPRTSPENRPVPPIPADLPAVLRREAERSVLAGWALPSEGDTARTRAADALLHRISAGHGCAPSGWKVPASVKNKTATRLRKGDFGVTPFPGR